MIINVIRFSNDDVVILDQRALPKESYKIISSVDDMIDAIKTLAVRGAPLIGIAAGFGCYLAVKSAKNYSDLLLMLKNAAKKLIKARPTAVNLYFSVDKMMELACSFKPNNNILHFKNEIKKAALDMLNDEIAKDEAMAKFGTEFIHGDALNILTHCNTGTLATGGIGTALGVIKRLAQSRNITVWVDETRPLLQGSRLTAYELGKMGIKYHIICDSAAGYIMSKGIDAVIIGADRIASNGDTANKVGSYSLSIMARYHNIPFIVVAPACTIDSRCPNGDAIPVEQRNEIEVTTVRGVKIAPNGASSYNPAFDIVPNKLISAIITEKGIYALPFRFT